MASVCRFLRQKLRLTVNASKSAVARPDDRTFLGFRLTTGAAPQRLILAGGGAQVPGASARADEQDARDQYRADGRLLEAVSARLAKLFRLQPGPAGALQPGCADSPETPDGYLAAVGHGADPIRQFEATGRPAHASGGGRWLSHWLLGDVAPRGRPTSAAQCLLRFARPPPSRRFFGRITLPNRRGTGPVCPVV